MEIAEVLERHSEILFTYLCGSMARGEAGKRQLNKFVNKSARVGVDKDVVSYFVDFEFVGFNFCLLYTSPSPRD